MALVWFKTKFWLIGIKVSLQKLFFQFAIKGCKNQIKQVLNQFLANIAS